MGVNTPMHMPKTVSSAQYARIMNEAVGNMNQDPIYTAEQIAGYEKEGIRTVILIQIGWTWPSRTV